MIVLESPLFPLIRGVSSVCVAWAMFGFIHLTASAQTLSSRSTPTVPAGAQGSSPIEFDVVSIKPAHGDGWLSKFTEDEYIGEAVPVYFLIRVAFYPLVAGPDISGLPKWAKDTYDIRAKVAAQDVPVYRALTREQQGVMLQKLLADRFQFRFHYGTTIHSVYELTTAVPNPKLAKLQATQNYGGKGYSELNLRSDGALRFHASPDHLAGLAKVLSWSEDAGNKMVMGRTGVTEFYNIDLWWCPLERTSETQPSNCSGPSLAMVLKEQLGLQMNPAKASLPTVTIDHIDRPTPN